MDVRQLKTLKAFIREELTWARFSRNGMPSGISDDDDPYEEQLELGGDEFDEYSVGPVPPVDDREAYYLTLDPYTNDWGVLPTPPMRR